jgi:hypothetical protein
MGTAGTPGELITGIFVIVLVMFDLFLDLGKTMPWK